MAMPEAAMDKNDSPMLAKHDVRVSNDSLRMKPIPITKSGKNPSNHAFRPRVFAPDQSHLAASFSRG
jgi:hypothetical protein